MNIQLYIYTGFDFFLVVLALYAFSILSFVTAPKIDSSDDEADFKFWDNIYFYNQRINK